MVRLHHRIAPRNLRDIAGVIHSEFLCSGRRTGNPNIVIHTNELTEGCARNIVRVIDRQLLHLSTGNTHVVVRSRRLAHSWTCRILRIVELQCGRCSRNNQIESLSALTGNITLIRVEFVAGATEIIVLCIRIHCAVVGTVGIPVAESIVLPNHGRTERRNRIGCLEIRRTGWPNEFRRCLRSRLELHDFRGTLRWRTVLTHRREVSLTILIEIEGIGTILTRLTQVRPLECQRLAGNDLTLVGYLGITRHTELIHGLPLTHDFVDFKLLEAARGKGGESLIDSGTDHLRLYGPFSRTTTGCNHTVLHEVRCALHAVWVASGLTVRVKERPLLPLSDIVGAASDMCIQNLPIGGFFHVLFHGATEIWNHIVVCEIGCIHLHA